MPQRLRKKLQEKGYTFFKMQDYPEFIDDYNNNKKYVCNSKKNLLDNIKGVRIDGHGFQNNKIVLSHEYESFENAEKIVNTKYLPFIDTLNSFSQYWFYGNGQSEEPESVMYSIKNLITKIVGKIYDEDVTKLKHHISLTYYKPGCFLEPHRDGKTGTRICAVLIYLNDDDYKTEWGGNIVFEGTETVQPIYGNVAILDFKEGNCLHEVKKVVDGYGRYAILDFVSLGESVNTPNHY
jgi:Rps23 Pro-64 3,4-dihydroxylase Tpa1-like proline 4-hydroxylase